MYKRQLLSSVCLMISGYRSIVLFSVFYILWASLPRSHLYAKKYYMGIAPEIRATLRPTSTTTTSRHSRCLLTRQSPARTASRRTSTYPPSDTRPCTGWERAPALEPTKIWSSIPRRQSSFRYRKKAGRRYGGGRALEFRVQ